MRLASLLLAVVLAAIAGIWLWLGTPVRFPGMEADKGEPLYCVSYAPFRGSQTPFDPTTIVSYAQVEEDLTRIKKVTNCVRTYASDMGGDHVPAIASKLGMKVLLGIWINKKPADNKKQVDQALEHAKKYPEVVRAIIVGNEVLLRRDQNGAELAAIIKDVKSRTTFPVTYADVWEFWLKNPELSTIVDFITIHTLPYWEDIPIAAEKAAAHIHETRMEVAKTFPNKEILIGEVGWPSAGRMRAGALPSLSNQARILHDVSKIARDGNYKFNWIEVIDQPWKREAEGTVGGFWGLFNNGVAEPKFYPGEPVSDHPKWKSQAILGGALALAIFGLAGLVASREKRDFSAEKAVLIAVVALTSGALGGMVIEKLILETLHLKDWVFGLGRTFAVFAIGFAVAVAIVREMACPTLSSVSACLKGDLWQKALGVLYVAICFFALQAALALIFDSRYRDFPAATLTMGLIPYVALMFQNRGAQIARGERVLALAMIIAAGWVIYSEEIANWQAVWFALTLGGVALLLTGGRANRQIQQQ